MVEDERGQQGEFLALVLGSAQHLLDNIFGNYGDMVIDWVVVLRGLGEVVGTLSPRERQVLEYRYGFRDGGVRTLKETGEIVGVSRERIRQIEAKALRKLRHPSRSRKLRAGMGLMMQDFVGTFDSMKRRLEEMDWEKSDAGIAHKQFEALLRDAEERGMSARVSNTLARNYLNARGDGVIPYPGAISDLTLMAMRNMGVGGIAEIRRFFPLEAPPSVYKDMVVNGDGRIEEDRNLLIGLRGGTWR